MAKNLFRQTNPRPGRPRGTARHGRIGILFLLLLAIMLGFTPVTGEAPPDFEWKRVFDPVHGAFNRDEPNPVRLALQVKGKVEGIPIAWRIIARKTVADSGDTLVLPAKRAQDTVFTLRLPPLSPGNYLLDVIIDPHNVIEEKDERNNNATFAFAIPNGAPVRFRCEGPEVSTWEIYRVELSTSAGDPYPDDFGTVIDTARSSEYEAIVNGVEPGDYIGVFLAPSVNRVPILISQGSFEMPDPPEEIEVVWPRSTPYLIGRPSIKGDVPVTVGGETGAPRWQMYARISLDGTLRNPTDEAVDVQWLLRFLDTNGNSAAELDTLQYIGAIGTAGIFLSGRIPDRTGNFLMQAEVRVPWPIGFEDLGEDFRAASFVLPLGWIEVEP